MNDDNSLPFYFLLTLWIQVSGCQMVNKCVSINLYRDTQQSTVNIYVIDFGGAIVFIPH
jgi:hypothetical protein